MAATVWKGHLTFGLVSLPVKLFTAARAESVSFNQLHRADHSRVKHKIFCAAEDVEISRGEIVKGYEYEKDRYVVLDDEEIKKMAPKSAKVMEILEFVKEAEVDPVYYESSYYMAPDEAGEKPYALLLQALKQSGYVALAKIAMHNREHIVILRPSQQGITLHTMYYDDEIRKTESFRTDTSVVKEKELSLALMLIESLAAPFVPANYHDTYRDNLKAMIEAKIQGQEVVAPAEAQPVKVIDIMDALKASLAALKKPVSTEAASEASTGEARKIRRSGNA
ncbi:MAG: Ku protein [Acidobacteria bacterium]|nr:Ku protein [Acidobacteriota bacterium]